MARRPLSRPMFRVPGASRQPAGILASSPQLIQAAQRNMMPPAMQPPGMMPINMPQPAPVQGPLTGVGPDMFGVQRRQVSAVTAPPAPVTPAALPPSYDATAVMDQVAGGLGSEVLPKPKPSAPIQPEDFGTIDERSAGTLGKMTESTNEFRAATDRILAGTPTRNDKILAGKSINDLYADLESKMTAKAPSLKDYNLADFEDLAMQTLGYKEGDLGPSEVADKDRRTSFWLSLIKAGLATAAGESPYLLTNLARGLSFGVESFGKDMNTINEQEREEKRLIAATKLDLMKDQRSVDTAQRAIDIQAAQMKVQLAENIRGEAREDAFRQIDMESNFAKIELDLYKYVNEENRAWEQIDASNDQFQQRLKVSIAQLQPDIIRGMFFAPGYVEATKDGVEIDLTDPSTYRLTEKGVETFNNWIANKGTRSITDTVRTATAAKESAFVGGALSFAHKGDGGGEIAERVSLLMGDLPASADERAAYLVPFARQFGAQVSAGFLIDYILNEPGANLTDAEVYDKSGALISNIPSVLDTETRKKLLANVGSIIYAGNIDPDQGSGEEEEEEEELATSLDALPGPEQRRGDRRG